MPEANRFHFVTGPTISILSVCLLVILSSVHANSAVSSITAIKGLKVGHRTLESRPTGCSVILAEEGAVAAVDVRGAAPGTRETDLLEPENTVDQVHAIVLAGGSAFGLAAADGVMRYLAERDIGVKTAHRPVPIVPAAIIYDLGLGNPELWPTATCGYLAADSATEDDTSQGNVGAGAGATVGKLAGPTRAMKGGLGTSLIELPSGLQVAAIMVVNAVGDVIDPNTGRILAGARTADGNSFADSRILIRAPTESIPHSQHTTVGVVATNAILTKSQLTIIARMAHDGLARAVRPSHTPADGDTIFALSTGTYPGDANLLSIGALAAEATASAIVNGILSATSLPGYPSARDFQGGVQ